MIWLLHHYNNLEHESHKKFVFLVPRVVLAYQQSTELKAWLCEKMGCGIIVGGQTPGVRRKVVISSCYNINN